MVASPEHSKEEEGSAQNQALGGVSQTPTEDDSPTANDTQIPASNDPQQPAPPTETKVADSAPPTKTKVTDSTPPTETKAADVSIVNKCPETNQVPCQEPEEEDKPWALRLGEYLKGRADGDVPQISESEKDHWAVQLGDYLRRRKPGPWSFISENKNPDDPMALRLGNYLNEVQPLKKVVGGGSDDPVVLRLGNYLAGDSVKAKTVDASVQYDPPEIDSVALSSTSKAETMVAPATDPVGTGTR